MLTKTLKIVLVTTLVTIMSVITYAAPYAKDRGNSTQKVSNPIHDVPSGLEKAAQQLESRILAHEYHNAVRDAAEDLKKPTIQQ